MFPCSFHDDPVLIRNSDGTDGVVGVVRLWSRARRIGIEAAMMVMAPSAVPRMKRPTVVTGVC